MCGPVTCTVSFGYSGAAQGFTVPDGVTALSFNVLGAAGGTSRFHLPGGGGGSVTGTLPVVAGQNLTLVVGQAGNVNGVSVYGGGGASGPMQYLGSGGGGSFVFASSGSVLVAAGGGGGAATDGGPCGRSFQQLGGAGSGAQSPGGGGTGGCYSGETPATGGQSNAPGAGGLGPHGNGANGTGPAGAFLPGVGGAGGSAADQYYVGGGGGGGYYGGGGGGYAQSGAGGSGFVSPTVTDAISQTGAHQGDGSIVLSWPALVPTVAVSITAQPGGNAGDADTMTATVSGAAVAPTGTVTFTVDGHAVSDCAPQTITNGVVACTTTALPVGSDSIQASYSGDNLYGPGSSQTTSYLVPGPVQVTTTSLSIAAVDSPYSAVMSATGGVGPYTWTLTSGVLPAGLTLSAGGLLQGTPSSAGGTAFTVLATDSQQRPVTNGQALNLAVDKASQTITYTTTAPTSATVGQTYNAVAIGGSSGNPVVLSLDAATTMSACSLSGSNVTFDHLGTCVIDADQGGNNDYSAALPAQQQISVAAIVPVATLQTSATTLEFGQPLTASVRLLQPVGGQAQFIVDGLDFGSPMPLTTGEVSATLALVDAQGHGLTVGSHQLDVRFTPADATRYATVLAGARTVSIQPARITTSLTVRAASLSLTVSRVVPGLLPTGTVAFYVDGKPVGTAVVSGGTATLAYRVPQSQSHNVAAVFTGTTGFLTSSVSAARHNPSITATLHSTRAKSRYGWYAGPVTATFTCKTDGSALTTACPKPVTFNRSGAAQSLSRTVMAVDGGIATAVVKGVNIDRGMPKVRIAGVTAGRTYFLRVPLGACAGSDTLSGVATCKITRRIHASRVDYLATVTDRAGRAVTVKTSAYQANYVLEGASSRNGVYTVRAGRSYSLRAATSTRPYYIDASPAPQRPRGLDVGFLRAGQSRWTLGVNIDRAMLSRPLWNLGVLVGSTTHVIAVRVER
ncbi:MAG: hypothetical protein JWN95_2640 [Frankiales bacterium]|nr:hypothetical protein [Frankiales bacterium]